MIYGYIRVSTEKQSTENQRFEIRNYLKKKGFKIDRWIIETVSGTTHIRNRKLGKLLIDIKKGDTLITTELSRLGRNLMHIMNILHYCMEQNVTVITIKEGYELGDNINSKILAFAFGLSAEIERNLISQRTREALARKKKEGSKLGRPKGKAAQFKLTGKESIIKNMLDNKCSMNEIAKKFDVSRQTLRDFLRETFPDWRKNRYQK